MTASRFGVDLIFRAKSLGAALLLSLGLAACGTVSEAPPPPPVCPDPGGWLLPASGEASANREVLAGLVDKSVVLLGETHDRAEHHRWQLQLLAGLYALRSDLVIGFEAFPRTVQPALDRWTAGELDSFAFLAEARWREVWNIDADLYLPLFHFARMNRIPMLALNVERARVRRVSQEGSEGVPELARAAPAPPAYLDRLAAAYGAHQVEDAEEAAFDRDDPQFRRFTEAQLLWDRAMAEALFEARQRPGAPLVVGIIGQGHLRDGHGVPWQLADMGLREVAVLLPYETGPDCDPPAPQLADAVFGLDYDEPVPHGRPRLGVAIEAAEDGLRITEVRPGSVAERADLRAGDVIEMAAGRALAQPADLIAIVGRQAPGTWLPLALRRGAETLEIVARFPAGH
jgi:uncharacterized iron-regulated protein